MIFIIRTTYFALWGSPAFPLDMWHARVPVNTVLGATTTHKNNNNQPNHDHDHHLVQIWIWHPPRDPREAQSCVPMHQIDQEQHPKQANVLWEWIWEDAWPSKLKHSFVLVMRCHHNSSEHFEGHAPSTLSTPQNKAGLFWWEETQTKNISEWCRWDSCREYVVELDTMIHPSS